MPVPPADRLKRYLTVILRWLSITFVVFVLALLSGRYITENLLHKVYTATAEMQLRPEAEVPPTEFEIITSPDFLLPIIYDLSLDKAWAKRLEKSDSDALPSPDALLPQDALAHLHKILKLDVKRGTNIINISVSSDNPKEAADIANAVADRYKTLRDAEKNQGNHLQESPVRILSRAEIPTVPSKPNQALCLIVTILAAGLLSVMVASFIEMMLLVARASERQDYN